MPRPRSPASSPLLSSAQEPGMGYGNQRTSESSISSLMSADARHGYSSAGRSLGPTAQPYKAVPSRNPSDSHRTNAVPPQTYYDDEDDNDMLHTFTAAEKRNIDKAGGFDITSMRGWANALMLFVLLLALVSIFAIYPIISFYVDDGSANGSRTSGFNLGGINATGQHPEIPGMPLLIDPDTPEDVKLRTGFDGERWKLVFSDEFNKDGRTFYPGDDPFWTGMDIHYWPTNDFEWLDPSAVTTKDGHLVITMSQEPIHDLNLKAGMLQTWNQLCFNKNAYFEASVSLPGTSDVGGFWPGLWTLGNLGRAGYGASTEGTWPYSYSSCDIGTLANQTEPDGSGPLAALTTGSDDGPLSFLPGQRLSACTCPGEDHPGPDVSIGRAAPEIDMIEAQIRISVAHGEVSQSYQLAPYDDFYQFDNSTAVTTIYDPTLTNWNTYLGGYYQQAVSGLTLLPDRIYYDQVVGGRSGEFTVFGFEYSSYPEGEREKGYITWVADNKPSWTMRADAIKENPRTGVGRRLISEEPMYLIINLHASNNFQTVDWTHMNFPNYFRIDYIRVYQRDDGSGSIGCNPADRPTKDYINNHINAYMNPNLTTWEAAGYTFPKNRLIDTC